MAEELERLKGARIEYEQRRMKIGIRVRRMRNEKGHGRRDKLREKTREKQKKTKEHGNGETRKIKNTGMK